MSNHAAWLGLAPYTLHRRLADGRFFACGWLLTKSTPAPGQSNKDSEDDEMLVVDASTVGAHVGNVSDGKSWWNTPESIRSNVVKLGINLRTNTLKIIIPPATPEQWFYCVKSGDYHFSNDFRLLIPVAGLDLDERAVFSMFQYGAIQPPLTMSRTIQSIPKGHVLQTTTQGVSLSVFFRFSEQVGPDAETSDPGERIQKTLDDLIATVPQSTVLYFSGGVDSGLVAARLSEMGRTDVQLLNLSFGADDIEGQLALDMAKSLNMQCEQIMFQPAMIPAMLERTFRDYFTPYGDNSVVPTNALVHASLGAASSSATVIDGTGADGCFGIGTKYEEYVPLYRMARFVRRIVGDAYRVTNLWKYSGKLETIGRIAKRSVEMPLGHAAILAQNSLHGITYRFPERTRKELEQLFREHLESISRGMNRPEQLSHLDLIFSCTEVFARRLYDPLCINGVKLLVPFLEPEMLRTSASLTWEQKCEGGEIKGLPKRLLARSVPREYVYRRKSGFTTSLPDMFGNAAFQDCFNDVVLAPSNPLMEYCDRDRIQQLVDRTRQGQLLGYQTYNFLWSLLFTSQWLQQNTYRV